MSDPYAEIACPECGEFSNTEKDVVIERLEHDLAALREGLAYALGLAKEAAADEPAGVSNGLTFRRLKEIEALLGPQAPRLTVDQYMVQFDASIDAIKKA